MDKPTNDGDRATVGRAAAIIGFERLREGHPEAARVALVQALPHLDGAPELRWKGRSYTNLGEALLALGRIEEGCTALRRGSRALRKAEVDDEAALVQARLGAVLHSQGDVEAGLTRLRAAMDRATKAGLKERGSLRTDLGLAEASARRFDVALELLRRSARDAKNIGLVREEAFAHFGLASVGSEAGGREDEVRESLKHGLVLARSHRSPRLSAAGLFLVVVSRVLRGRPEAAELALQAAEAQLHRAASKAPPRSLDGRVVGLLSTALAGGTLDLRIGEVAPSRWRAHAATVRPTLALMHLRPVLLRPDVGDTMVSQIASSSGSWEY